MAIDLATCFVHSPLVHKHSREMTSRNTLRALKNRRGSEPNRHQTHSTLADDCAPHSAIRTDTKAKPAVDGDALTFSTLKSALFRRCLRRRLVNYLRSGKWSVSGGMCHLESDQSSLTAKQKTRHLGIAYRY